MSKCSCISENKFKFLLDYKDGDLIFTDYSEWVTAKHNTAQDIYTVSIVNEENGATSVLQANIGLSAGVPLLSLTNDVECDSDGIYTFGTEVCGVKYSRTEAILSSAQCAFEKVLIDNGIEDGDVKDIWLQMELVKASSKRGLIEQASEHYKVLVSMFKRLNCSC